MRYLLWSLIPAILLTLTALVSRPLLPVDETRYLAVAWEMHQSGDYLVSHLNTQPYSHKPPVLFWLINAVWSVTGVSLFAARCVAPIVGIICLPLIRMMARRLWPECQATANCAPLIQISSMIWMVFCPLTMFDTILTCCTLVALHGVQLASNHGLFSTSQTTAVRGKTFKNSGFVVAGVATGIGILTKGPVILIHLLPTMLLAPWWSSHVRTHPGKWYAGIAVSIVIAAVIGLSWAIPSAISGGEAYADDLLFGQTTGRIVSSFAHRQPFWWYLPWLPLCLLPWLSAGVVLKGFGRLHSDSGLRFLICWALGSLLLLSIVSGKQIYYLLPMTPACSLIMARAIVSAGESFSRRSLAFIASGTIGMGLLPIVFNHFPGLSDSSVSGLVPDLYSIPLSACGAVLLMGRYSSSEFFVGWISTMAVLFVCVLMWSLGPNVWNGFDQRPLARFAGSCNRPLAWYGVYHGQLTFAGRINYVHETPTEQSLELWLKENPDGAVIYRIPSAVQDFSPIIKYLRTVDGPVSGPKQRSELADLLGHHHRVPLSNQEPEAIAVYWIRRGLIVDPVLVLTYPRRENRLQACLF